MDPERSTPSPPPNLKGDPEWVEWWHLFWRNLPVCCRSVDKNQLCPNHEPMESLYALPSPIEERSTEWDYEDPESDYEYAPTDATVGLTLNALNIVESNEDELLSGDDRLENGSSKATDNEGRSAGAR
jgi:hypothetical protein